MIGRIASALRRGWDGPREVALFCGAYLTYFGVRAITEGNVSSAITNAMDLVRFEESVSIDVEVWVQNAILGNQTIVDIANAIYMYGHWPVLIVGGVLLFNLKRPLYFKLRNACLMSGGIGLVIFALFPVAPPRLSGLGFLDTITVHDSGYRTLMPPSLVNEYAAMPSFHAGWNVLLGIFLFRMTHLALVRAFAVVMPAAMIFAVIATGNHFVLDVIVGVGIALLSYVGIEVVERRRARSTLDRDVPPRAEAGATPRGAAVRGRSPRRERPHPAAAGRAPAGRPRRG